MEIENNISKKLFNPINLPREMWLFFSGGNLIDFSNAPTEGLEVIKFKKPAPSYREQEDLRELKNEK